MVDGAFGSVQDARLDRARELDCGMLVMEVVSVVDVMEGNWCRCESFEIGWMVGPEGSSCAQGIDKNGHSSDDSVPEAV